MRRREITRAEAAAVIETLGSFDLTFTPAPLLLQSAIELAEILDRTVYDCLYLALAIDLNCPLVTADRKFHAAVAGSPLSSSIRWIGDEV